jgi:hypothetical protein
MKYVGLTTGVLLALAIPIGAKAQVIDDPLHGEICSSGSGGCSNATAGNNNTPIFQGATPLTNFGFAASPANTGTLTLTILIPTTGGFGGAPMVDLNGGSPLTSVLFSNGFGHAGLSLWAAGVVNGVNEGNNPTLSDFLQNAGSPSNPLGNYLSATDALEVSLGLPQAIGFGVFQVSGLGPFNLPNPSSTGQNLPDIFSMAGLLPAGSFIVAELTNSSGVINTVNSGALFVTPTAAVPEPTTWAMMLLGFIGLAFAFRHKRRIAYLA